MIQLRNVPKSTNTIILEVFIYMSMKLIRCDYLAMDALLSSVLSYVLPVFEVNTNTQTFECGVYT